jgi:hypothetical protein
MAKLLSVVVLFFLFSSCKKEIVKNVNEPVPAGTVIVAGNFVSNVHPTSGTVKVVTDAGGKKLLVFENFKSDNGPDLRIWLSPNLTAATYQEIGVLKALSGNFSYELAASIDYTVNSRVLIWCEDFSVLFGHAVLQ